MYFACVNFFFFFFLSLFNDRSENTYLRISTGPIFANFSPNESVLGATDRSGPLFPMYHGPWQPILWKNGKLPSFVALAFRNGMRYRYFNGRINSVNDVSISCKNFVNFGPVTPELTELICERLVRHGQKTGVFNGISPDTLIHWTDFHNLFTE